MRFLVCVSVLAALAACQSDGHPASAVSGKVYFERCAAAGWSITYQKKDGPELEALEVPWLEPRGLSPDELDAHLDRALAGHGFHAERVGPATVRVLAILRDA